jgi:hypothetical protein
MNIIFYNSYDLFLNPSLKTCREKIPGAEQFSSFFQIFSDNITCIDRSGVITTPLKTKLLTHLRIPEYSNFNKSFEEICDDRAKEILKKCEEQNKKLAVMYSGGIDSTLMLCSLLKNGSENQLKNVFVLLSELSIMENKNFYNNYIIKKFNCVSSYAFVNILGNDDYLLITGDNADLIFGSQMNDHFTMNRNYREVFNPIDDMQGHIIDFFKGRLLPKNKKYAESMFLLFKKITDSCPVELDNVYKFFWWISFTTKWQSVYVRILPFSKNINNIKLEENFTTFYHTKEFQLWSLNNTNNFVKDSQDTVKYIAKDYIYNFNKDSDYLKKLKIGSLGQVARRKSVPLLLSEDFQVINDWPDSDLFNYDNDFVSMANLIK